jgi:hypothetical protein
MRWAKNTDDDLLPAMSLWGPESTVKVPSGGIIIDLTCTLKTKK